MLPAQVTALADKFVKAFDTQHPLPYKLREAGHYMRHPKGGMFNGPIPNLEFGDLAQMGRFLAEFLDERTKFAWAKLQTAVTSTAIPYYEGLNVDLLEQVKIYHEPHHKRFVALLAETSEQWKIPSGYSAESLRLFQIVLANVEAEIDMFCANYFMNEKNKQQSGGVKIEYHLSGANSRVNIGSQDYSINVAESQNVFSQLTKTINENIQDENVKATLLAKTSELQDSIGKPSAWKKYQEWIAAGANHMSLLGPFVPYITELLHKAGIT